MYLESSAGSRIYRPEIQADFKEIDAIGDNLRLNWSSSAVSDPPIYM
jgi:hypothetical protein